MRCAARERDTVQNEAHLAGLWRRNRLEPLALAIGGLGARGRRCALGAQDRTGLDRPGQLLLRASWGRGEQGHDQQRGQQPSDGDGSRCSHQYPHSGSSRYLLFFACVYLRPEQETTEANPQLQVTLEASAATPSHAAFRVDPVRLGS